MTRPGRVEGKVAFITGAARGQGRSHALRLAEEGADIIAVDLCQQLASVPYPMGTAEDLAETAAQVTARGRRIFAVPADVRDDAALQQALDEGVARLGRLDIVSANAGIFVFGDQAHEVSERDWHDVIDTNLTGVWHTAKAAAGHLIRQGTGGSIVITSSTAGLKGIPHLAAYSASKHAVVGLARTLALELAPHSIRVNTVHPGGVDTPMVQNDAARRLFLPQLSHPTREQAAAAYQATSVLPVPWVEPRDVSNAVLFLASDEARYITGIALPVDAGYTIK